MGNFKIDKEQVHGFLKQMMLIP